ncbi:MAG: DUF1579 family protein [Candidatus Zixiibacteriota bacterium]
MRLLVTLVVCCCLGVVLGVTAATMAQDQKMSDEQMAAAMQEWMKLAAPGEHHKNLDYFVGKWTTTTKTWMAGPESTPTETKGASEIKWIMDGRFLLEDHKGQMMGMPYTGMGLVGYDNYRNMYSHHWINNMGTNVMAMSGHVDPSGKVFTFYGEMDEPMLKITGRTIKYVTTIKGPDQYVFEVIDLHASENYKVFEMVYDRQK